jgi:SAM-dependent methyltransferase
MSTNPTVSELDGGPAGVCPACGSGAHSRVELVASSSIAEVWRAENPEAGRIIDSLLAKGDLAAEIETRECRACALQFFVPSFAAGPDWYAVVEKYADRWEHGEALSDLGPAKKRVLELGCGAGEFLCRLKDAGHEPLGLDFNPSAVAIARERGCDARVGDLRSLAETVDEPPDAIAGFHVIEHVEDLDRFFCDLRSLSRPGSMLLLSCPGPRRYTSALLPDQRVGLRDMWDYPPHHQTRWRPSAMSALLERQGWAPLRFADEPFDWRGVATYLASRRARDLASLGRFARRRRIARELARTIGARRRYTGMSLYCLARCEA